MALNYKLSLSDAATSLKKLNDLYRSIQQMNFAIYSTTDLDIIKRPSRQQWSFRPVACISQFAQYYFSIIVPK